MEIYTIGFAQKSAARFFGTLRQHGIRRLIDIRLKNKSQLAGFTKGEDLKFFLKEICGAEYVHLPVLAPTPELLSDYRHKTVSWNEYERRFLAILAERKVEQQVDPNLFAEPAVLLCSEPAADRCHRRLVAEYLAQKWGGIRIVHL